ncbi:hypothetical protein BGW80DRAFT_1462373 [Lactifluus volemus]|nr:hypothetical protein BGW80DRAFT_1462373 [Lactifluus volemus]
MPSTPLRNDKLTIPPANAGFHSGFIRSTKHRKETREQLITNIRDLISELERCCGVGCILVAFQGEQEPRLAQLPVSALTLNERNVRLMYSEIFQIKIFSPAISDIQEVCLRQLGIAYLRDFRTRAHKSKYFANVRLESETTTKSLISPSVRDIPPLYEPESRGLSAEVVNNALAASPTPRLIAPTSTNTHLPFDPVHSQLSSMCLSDDDPSPVTPPSPSHSLRTYLGSPNPLVVKLPSDVRDLLAALGERDTIVIKIQDVYHNVARSSHEAALIALGFNRGTSKALAFLMQLRSTLLRSTPPTLVMSTITIPPTSRPGAGTNAPSCSERARKSDEQRAQEKEHKLARKVKIKAAVDVAIDQIDDIIEGLAAETGIGFKQACSYVHLGGRIFKGRRRPSIQNAYRFCSARVEDGRWNESDGVLIADAIRIMNELKQNKDSNGYKSLSKDDQDTLITLLQEDRDRRDTGVVGKRNLNAQDIRSTMERIGDELEHLNSRSGFEYIVLGSRDQVDRSCPQTVLLSEGGCDFISQYLRFEPTRLAKHLDAFVTNRAGMNGVIRRIASDECSGDTKTATKYVIMGMFKKMYSDLTKRESFRLDWTAWSKGIPDRHNVVICGWPLAMPPTTLSKIHTASEMNRLLVAVTEKTCYFDMASDNERRQTQCTTEGARDSDAPLYRRGGTLIDLENNSSSHSSGSKRKRSPNGSGDGNKENISPDASVAAPPLKRPHLDLGAESPMHPASDRSESVSDGMSDDSLFLPPRSSSTSGTEDGSFSVGTSPTDMAHSLDPLWDYPELRMLSGGILSDTLSDSVSSSLSTSFNNGPQSSTMLPGGTLSKLLSNSVSSSLESSFNDIPQDSTMLPGGTLSDLLSNSVSSSLGSSFDDIPQGST